MHNIPLRSGSRKYDYYVNSNVAVPGNGRTPLGAFRNLSDLPTIASGMRIGLARGSTWNSGNEKITSTGGVSNVAVEAYGSGASPVIDCGDQVTSGNWTKTAARTNVYETASITFPAGNGGTSVNTWINVTENGVFLQFVATQALVDTTVGSYTIVDMTASAGVIYVRASSGIPTTNGKTYKYSARPWAIKINGGSGNSVTGITASLNGEHDGSIILGGDGSAPLLRNCTLNLGGKHNAFLTGGGICTGCTFNDAYYTSSSNMLVFFEGTGSGLGVNVFSTTFNYGVNTAGQGNPINAVGSHANAGTLGPFVSSNLNINATGTVNTFTGIEPSNVSSMSITGGVLQGGIQEGIGMDDSISLTVTGTQYVSTWNQNHFIGPGNSTTITLTNTLACVTNVQTAIFRMNSKTPVTLTMTGNNWYLQSTQGAAFWEFIACAGSERLDITANNNTFHSAKAGAWYFDMGTNASNVFTGNSNHYVGTSPNWFWHGSTKTSLATWQSSTGQDASADTSGDASGSCSV